MVNNKLVDITGLSRYHENLKSLLNGKQDNIEDLEDIRSGAASGASALDDAKAYADSLAINYDADGAAAQALVDAKAYTDSKVDGKFDEAGAAAAAQAAAIADAESKYQVKGNYEAAGAAAQALVDAKAYTDSKVDGKFDESGAAAQALVDAKAYVDGKDSSMGERVKVLEEIDHAKLASDAADAAVAAVVAGAPDAFDTLKDVADWIANNDHAQDVATLVTDVATLKAINHDAYIAADEVALAAAKKYADEEIAKLSFDGAGAAAQALVDAKAYTDSKVDGKFDEAGAAAQALTDAKAYVDGKGYLVAGDLQFATDGDIDGLFV